MMSAQVNEQITIQTIIMIAGYIIGGVLGYWVAEYFSNK